MKNKRYLIATAIILGLTNIFISHEIIIRSAHVLYQKPEWVSAKSLIPNGLISAQEFFLERQTLAKDRLNLSEWNGPNEAHWNINKVWDQFKFDVSLADKAYIWIFVAQDEIRRYAFRLSRNEKFKSGFFELNLDKEFAQKNYFDYENKSSNFQNITIKNENNQINLLADDKMVFSKDFQTNTAPLISFRSSLDKVIIDNIKLINKESVIEEDFSPKTNIRIILFSVIANLILFFIIFRYLKKKDYAQFKFLSVQMLMVLSSLSYLMLDRYIWSANYYYNGFVGYGTVNITDVRMDIDKARRNFFNTIFSLVGDSRSAFVLSEKNYMSKFFIPENTKELSPIAKKIYFSNGLEENTLRIRQKYINTHGRVEYLNEFSDLARYRDPSYKIAFLGTSQTFGGGAMTMDKSFPSQVVTDLNKYSTKPITAFNFSAPGEDSEEMIKKYKEIIKYWKPRLLIVNLAHNDKDLNAFKNNLDDLVNLNKKINVKTIFIKEPNSLELGDYHLREKHQVMQDLAQRHNILILDLQRHLSSDEIYDKGLIWWDIVHFDQAGHNAVAKWLTNQLKKHYKNPRLPVIGSFNEVW